ncbi:thiamine/thiamine pyrophosphate ABC transporter permease [Shinella curvata]|uniref:Thiamine transport system permease protein ThiP n=1 Tax=Shinella curvata TaxID=1817964 RepID=A0ABT8XLK9_9HYPH|nr:thiamine/thiamine pyrophosphate ABC transporter permease [Shinella curvata]MCJ8056359.1 thiamine/thiamine pyrophosphate ABC transporter permease [Shinella curvata]MDO6124070.1 thiamine/thiamine pyrophosphate ABC transporter permease [Shinella curvata]
MFARAERRTLRVAGGLALGFVLVFAGAATAVLLAHAGGSGAPLFDAYTWRVAQFTLMQATLSTLLSVVLAIPVARALARQRTFPGRVWILRLSVVPLGLPALVAALGIIEIWGRQGVVNDLLRLGGLESPVSVYGLAGILIAHVFFNMPLAARFLLAALDRIPPEYWLTSANLGMGSGATFRLIEWPVIRRVLPGIAGLIFMLCAASFTVVLTLGGGPAATTIEVAIYQALRFDFDPQRAVLLSGLQIAVTGVLIWLLSLFARPPEEGMTAGRDIRRFDGRRRRLSDGLILLVFTLFTAAPLAATLVSGLSADFGRLTLDPLLHRALATSLAISFASGCLSLAIALPIVLVPRLAEMGNAGLATRLMARALPATGSLILLVPPVVVATGWFLMLRTFGETGRFAPVIITVVNALMALPFVVRVLEPAYSTHLTRTARLALSLGVTGMHRLRWIDWPALKKPFLTAFAFAMALSLGDLSAVAIFGAEGFATLPWLLFSRMASYRTADAAGIALILGVICLLLTLPSTAAERPTESPSADA